MVRREGQGDGAPVAQSQGTTDRTIATSWKLKPSQQSWGHGDSCGRPLNVFVKTLKTPPGGYNMQGNEHTVQLILSVPYFGTLRVKVFHFSVKNKLTSRVDCTGLAFFESFNLIFAATSLR